ncbi:MAG TPA: hypothetical protein VFQ53_37935 [Kofleriaceae bacterium]|nr:hypothetical protein [Kofleriaceae bacterium]
MRPRWIVVAAWLVFLLYAYPGYLPTSGVDQLASAYRDAFQDPQAAIMIELWRTVCLAMSGPAGMLLLQSGLLVAGSFVVFARAWPARTAAYATAGMLLAPPVLATTAVIATESQMVGFLAAAIACLTSPRRAVRLLGLAACVIACGIQTGGPVATLPIVVLGFAWRIDRGWRRYAIAGATWLGVALLAAGLAHLLVDEDWRTTELTRAAVDVVGTLAHAPALDDAHARDALAGVPVRGADLQARARQQHGDPVRFAEGSDALLVWPTERSAIDATIDARARLARAYPGAYLAHRADVFARVLGLRDTEGWEPVYTDFLDARGNREIVAHDARHSPVQKLLTAPVRALGGTPVFWPVIYAALAVVLLALAFRWRERWIAIVLASGLAFEASLFATVAIPQFRQSHWLIASVVMSAIWLGLRWRGRRADDRRTLSG